MYICQGFCGASDVKIVKFLGNEELQLTLTGEANISYEYSGDGSVTFNGDLDAANVQFMGHVVPIFDPNVFMDVMIQRTTAPDGTYWDTMVVHADNADGDYVASFMWLLGGSALSVTSQAEFDTLVASVSNYATENIPSNAVYGPGKDNWLTVLSDIEVTSANETGDDTQSSSSSADTTGPQFSDFTIIENDIESGGSIKTRYKIEDANGFDDH